MARLFASQSSVDFGPCYLQPAIAPRVEHVVGSRPSVLRGHVRQLCPKRPGVYGMFDRHGELIYVGKAKSLRCRLLSYFRVRSRDARSGRIIARAAAIAWEPAASEFAALHRELELIRRWRPRFNVHGQPDARRPTYVCLGRQPAPYLFLARQPPRDALAFYGPVSDGARVREAVRRLNDVFLLRDCPQSQPMRFADQGELFASESAAGCLRYEIGTCLGPCAGGCSRRDYGRQVRAVRDFLEGQGEAALALLRAQMEEAAAAHRYEQAAVLRDKLLAVEWLDQKLGTLRRLRRDGSFVYPVRGHDGQVTWFLIQCGQTVAALPAPGDDAARRTAARELITAVYSTGFAATGDVALRRDSIFLVASWFRRYPQERQRVLQPEQILAYL